MSNALTRSLNVFIKSLVEKGCKQTLISSLRRIIGSGASPLSQMNKDLLFASNTEEVRKTEKHSRLHELGGVFSDSSNLEASYPLVYEHNGRILRYSYSKAEGEPKGLVVKFHGWGGEFSSGFRPKGWNDFDILAPWDTFGHNRRGSWFWGEKGDNFVEQHVQSLIKHYKQKRPGIPWFCYGISMGGFGALFHGIKYHADGVYVLMPQVDLKKKVEEYGQDNLDNPYGYLLGEGPQCIPDLLQMAMEQDSLPPLFLIQNQFDAVNPFAEHGLKLLDVYNRKKCWYGVRVYPAIGHTHDGKPEEAGCFFSNIMEKNFPRKFV